MPDYKTLNINNRRYLGNKYKLLPFITRVVEQECAGISSVVDIFAGTGAVASAFTDKIVITNDILYSNYICNYAWFSPERYSEKKIRELIVFFNALTCQEENYMTRSFADTYFSYEDCAKIGHIRDEIERLFDEGEINFREKAILIASLLYAMDRIAKTCGHYDAYRKGAVFDRSLELSVPLVNAHNHKKNKCYNTDSNGLVRKIKGDLFYIDPPYNSRQYCDAYHLLENVARWEKPEVFGVARKMNRDHLKSRYCRKGAADAFRDLIGHIRARYILLSYNNMATKGNDRSNAKISDAEIRDILSEKGSLQIFSEDYKPFTTGKSAIEDNQERLFLCTCQGEI